MSDIAINKEGGVKLGYIFPAILIFPGNLSGDRLITIPNQEQIRTKVIAAHGGAEPFRGTVMFFCAQKQGNVHQDCQVALSS